MAEQTEREPAAEIVEPGDSPAEAAAAREAAESLRAAMAAHPGHPEEAAAEAIAEAAEQVAEAAAAVVEAAAEAPNSSPASAPSAPAEPTAASLDHLLEQRFAIIQSTVQLLMDRQEQQFKQISELSAELTDALAETRDTMELVQQQIGQQDEAQERLGVAIAALVRLEAEQRQAEAHRSEAHRR